jgi:hypothetical protein
VAPPLSDMGTRVVTNSWKEHLNGHVTVMKCYLASMTASFQSGLSHCRLLLVAARLGNVVTDGIRRQLGNTSV